MKFVFITGKSGSGKTREINSALLRLAEEKESQRIFLVVPEQYTMQTQRNIVEAHPGHGTFNVDIVSFNRLAYRVFEELGISLLTTIDDTGKNLILRKVIDDNRDKLRIIKVRDSQGFVSEIKSVISELMQYSVTPELLEKACDEIAQGGLNNNERLRLKLKDILVIYKAFREYISEKYITAEEITQILCNCVGRSKLLDGSVIAFDGFTGFTPIQYQLIELLCDKADGMYFTASLPKDGDKQLFEMSYDMQDRLGRIADRNGFLTERVNLCENRVPYRFEHNPELAYLEDRMFRDEKKYNAGSCTNIEIYHALGTKAEAYYVASKIKELVSGGMRYREIGVIVSSPEDYNESVRNIFLENDIPAFMDNKRSILANPAVEYIRAAIGVIAKEYSYESAFRLMKSYMCPIDRQAVDLLENYVLALGIRGHKKWQDSFKRKMPSKRDMDMSVINNVRKEFCEMLEPLYLVFHDKDSKAEEMVQAIADFLEASNVYEKMKELTDRMEKEGNPALAKEYSQSYESIIALLEQMGNLLMGEKLNAKQFMDILDAGFNEIKIGIIPPTIDMVTVGDLERTRLDNIKVLFFMGVNEGLVPKSSTNKGLFSELEREILSGSSIELAPTSRQKACMQNFYLYLALSKPSDRIYFTVNKEMRPSKLITSIQKMFPDVAKKSDDMVDMAEMIYNPADGMDYIFSLLGDGSEWSDNDKALFSAMYDRDVFVKRMNEMARQSLHRVTDENITMEAARQLYGDMIKGSISRMESYAACAFSHFVKYGLDLEERRMYELGAADMGTIFHEALRIYSVRLKDENLNFASVDETKRTAYVKEAVDNAMTAYNNMIFYDSKRNEYMRRRIENIMLRTSWALGEQMRAGSYVPDKFEQTFNLKSDSMDITGKIDRIDIAHKDEKDYVKVVDYKSGKKKLDFGKVYDGLSLQLMMYLQSCMDGKVPGAAVYYNIDDPIVDYEDSMAADEADKKNGSTVSDAAVKLAILNALKPQGIVNGEASSLELLDKITKSGKSPYIPIGYNKDGGLTKTSQATTEDRLRILGKYAEVKMNELGEEIIQGKTAPDPYPDSCTYCPYKLICDFDVKSPDCSYRNPSDMGNDEESFKKFMERIDKNGKKLD